MTLISRLRDLLRPSDKTIGLLLILVFTASYALVVPVIGYERVVRLPADSRPEIPVCDKPLFERITEGCK